MEYEAAALYRAIRARLTAATEIWGSRAYAEIAPGETAYPYVIATIKGREPVDVSDRAALTVQIVCAAAGFAEALTGAGRIASLFDHADQGTTNALDGGTDWRILSTARTGIIQRTTLVDGVPIHEAGAVYRVMIEPVMSGATAGITRVIQFGGVLLPGTTRALRDNFADVMLNETRLPGLAGAFCEGGMTPPGRIECRIALKAENAASMAMLRDTVRGLSGLGAADLTIEPAPGQPRRVTRARVIALDLSEDAAARTDQHAEAAITFAAETPRWFGVHDPAQSGLSQACAGAQTDFTRTHAGNTAAAPAITVTATAPLTLVKIQRLVGGQPADEIAYTGPIPNAGMLVIDTRALTVTLNGSDAYHTAFSTLHPAWFRLLPGANTIRVVLGSGETAGVKLSWRDTWV